MTRLDVVVKPVEKDDLKSLMHALPYGSSDKHMERFQRQHRGDVLYLIAWYAGLPIGHGLLKWLGAEEKHIANHFQGLCPDVEDLYVVESMRSKGVGSQILITAENLAKQRGYTQIGLSVGVENMNAKNLYKLRGYRDSGLGEHSEGGEYVDAEGKLQKWEERCMYLVKSLEM